MDLFTKCALDDRADVYRAMGIYPYFHEIEANQGPTVTIKGKEVIMAGSNNYLGLTRHPEVIAASQKAAADFGTSCSGSRFLNGNLVLHTALEEELADWVGVERCLVFTSGFLTNQGIIPTLVNKGEYLVSDKDNHASIVAGALISKAMGGDIKRYRCNDMDNLAQVLNTVPDGSPMLLVSDSVFSMSGTVVNLPELVKLAKAKGARVMVDEAHSLGVLGAGGRGVAAHYGMKNGRDVDIVMGTFSKSFASLGGFCGGPKDVIEFIKHNSMALIFAASMPPSAVAAAHMALKIMKREPERVERLHQNAVYARQGLRAVGFTIPDDPTPIIPVIIGDDTKTFQFSHRLLQEGVFVNPVISPAVPQGMQLLRTFFMATHEKKHLDHVIESFAKVGHELGVLD
jgi:8-amino-7-oxononanoate synthase